MKETWRRWKDENKGAWMSRPWRSWRAKAQCTPRQFVALARPPGRCKASSSPSARGRDPFSMTANPPRAGRDPSRPPRSQAIPHLLAVASVCGALSGSDGIGGRRSDGCKACLSDCHGVFDSDEGFRALGPSALRVYALSGIKAVRYKSPRALWSSGIRGRAPQGIRAFGFYGLNAVTL